jgi:putative alpha-1,2-mannosidase
MTRWVAQTHENYVSVTPYNHTSNTIHGFQGTHQPAIWMGESGQVIVVPGIGEVKSRFDDRALAFNNATEVITPSYYRVDLEAGDGDTILAEQSASKVASCFLCVLTDSVPQHRGSVIYGLHFQ